jgi:hypothetical protein
MYFNLRRVGVQGEISKMRRRATTRARLVNAKVVEIIILYLIMDAAMSGPPPQNHLITREKQRF